MKRLITYLGQIRVFDKRVTGRIIHDEGERKGFPAGHFIHVIAESFHLLVHFGAGLLAVRLLLTELLRNTG